LLRRWDVNMKLPDELRTAVETETAGWGGETLARAAGELSRGYREGAAAARLSPAQRAAYAAVRLPATYAAVSLVLGELRARCPSLRVRRLLDLGAGPGTVAWAAAEVFPELEHVTCVERDVALGALGRKLAAGARHPAVRSAAWREADLERLEPDALDRHDLVVASYVAGELHPAAAARLLDAAWASSEGALAWIEPGTTPGFARILRARAALLALGARLVAPCPRAGPCPMEGRDWCHFAARVERSAAHRRAKGAALGHEDEKLSYVVAATAAMTDAAPAAARIVRRPLQRSGHVILDLCAPEGLARTVIGKREREAYRRARRADWGGAWELERAGGAEDEPSGG
jgi:ribosomal protein RSM22 (predicted rRNA methylase)